MTMTDDRQERIRVRAHQIWLDEGQPAGQHERHWHQATADVDREDEAGVKPKRQPKRKAEASAAKAPAAKTATKAPAARKPAKAKA